MNGEGELDVLDGNEDVQAASEAMLGVPPEKRYIANKDNLQAIISKAEVK